jgi:hypothetical protein
MSVDEISPPQPTSPLQHVRTHGQVLSFEKKDGRIKILNDAPEAAGEIAFFSDDDIEEFPQFLARGEFVDFDLARNDKGWQAKHVRRSSLAISASHHEHCFVVMPFGRTADEIRWFRGWYDVVIEDAVRTAGYIPILAAAEERPNAINDEIRTHLAFDPMVVVDLGGATPDADPNPNVMYELGIRHALSLPLVMMAWRNQRLPFDVGNQRVIMETRDLLDLDTNRKKLSSFIQAARDGHFYRPMDAVGRAATLELATASLSKDSLLGVLVQEVRDLRNDFSAKRKEPVVPKSKAPAKPKVLGKLLSNSRRKKLHSWFIKAGGTSGLWTKLLGLVPSQKFVRETSGWSDARWKTFFAEQMKKFDPNRIAATTSTTPEPSFVQLTGDTDSASEADQVGISPEEISQDAIVVDPLQVHATREPPGADLNAHEPAES